MDDWRRAARARARLGEVTLTSGLTAQYYVDAKRAILRRPGFMALGELLAERAARVGRDRPRRDDDGRRRRRLRGARRRRRRQGLLRAQGGQGHGLSRRIEGPLLAPEDRCLVVEDVVSTGGSTVAAIEALQEAGHEICGVVSVLDRLAGGGERIAAAAGAPYVALVTIDDIYPERPDR